MLTNLLQVSQALSLPLHDCRHPSESSSLELLASVKRIAVLEKPDIILGNVINEMPCRVQLAQGELVMVLVVEDIHQVRIERMDIFQFRELAQNLSQLFVEVGLGELHLSHVKRTDPGDFEVTMHHCGSFALCLGQNHVREVFRRWHDGDFLEVVI